jgi:hypothetical protein
MHLSVVWVRATGYTVRDASAKHGGRGGMYEVSLVYS